MLLEELILVLFVVRKTELLEDDLGLNQTLEIDNQNRFPVLPMYSMSQEASVCRCSAWNEKLESLLVDWERKTVSLCDSNPLIETHLKHSWSSSVLAWIAIVK